MYDKVLSEVGNFRALQYRSPVFWLLLAMLVTQYFIVRPKSNTLALINSLNWTLPCMSYSNKKRSNTKTRWPSLCRALGRLLPERAVAGVRRDCRRRRTLPQRRENLPRLPSRPSRPSRPCGNGIGSPCTGRPSAGGSPGTCRPSTPQTARSGSCMMTATASGMICPARPGAN